MLEVSRRTVVAFGAGTVGAIAIATFGAPPALGSPDPFGTTFTPAPPAGPPVRSHFADHIGETFVAATDAASTPLVLTAILDLPHAPAGDENCFSLVFTAPSGEGHEAAIYTLTHPVAPEAMLFLGPVGEPSQRGLQAIVNRAR